HFLTFMSETDQCRLLPSPAPVQVGQDAVVEAAAHAQASALLVETHQRHEDQVQRPRLSLARLAVARLGDAEAVGAKLFVPAQALKVHALSQPAAQDRQVDMDAAVLELASQQDRIDLAVLGQIQGDVTAA